MWYRGGGYRGFQAQPEGPTVQQTVEAALASRGIEARVMPSGRTDRGVHARMQVLSLSIPKARDPEELLSLPLPDDVGVIAAKASHRSFHSQWAASGKEYRYRFSLDAPPERWAPYCWQPLAEPRLEGRTLEVDRVAALLAKAVGRFDFIAFHEKSSPQKPRAVTEARLVELEAGVFEARLRGDSFARHMVRYLVGSAVATAAGLIPEADWSAAIAEGKTIEGLRAPGEGLVLWEVRYPPELDPFAAERERAWAALERPPFGNG